MSITPYAQTLLRARGIDDPWVIEKLETIDLQFRAAPANWPDDYATDNQIGYLAGLLDVEKADRLQLLEILLGQPLPGTMKCTLITKWIASVLIDYYINQDGKELNERLGFEGLGAKRTKRRAERLAAKQTSAALDCQHYPEA